jgi:hypothetical protein
MGGVLKLQVVRKADVKIIPQPVSGIIYGALQLNEGASTYNWAVSYQSAGITSVSSQKREGISKESELVFFVTGDSEDLRSMFETASLDEFIVLFQYPNTVQKIFGTIQAPVQFAFDHDSGTSTAARHGYTCRFFYSGPDNSFFYRADMPAAPTGPAPSVVEFNDVVIAILQPGEKLKITSDYSFTEYFKTQ